MEAAAAGGSGSTAAAAAAVADLLVSGLSIADDGAAPAAAAVKASSGGGSVQRRMFLATAADLSVADEQLSQLALTPEQDAAAQALADQAIALYEEAFLSRAVRRVADACAEQGLPEAAVAAKLRRRGVDLRQLQERAAEVQRGVGCVFVFGCVLRGDEGGRLLSFV